MTGEEVFTAESKSKAARRKSPLHIAALLLTIFAASALAYGFANGYIRVSFVNPEKQAEQLRSEIAEISKQKEILEQKKAEISQQLEKTKILVEKAKDSSPAVEAHIQVMAGSCLSCPPPAWVESYRTAFSSLEEIEKIIGEDNSAAPSLPKKSEN